MLGWIMLLPIAGGALLPLLHLPQRSRWRGVWVEAVVCATSALVLWRVLAAEGDGLTLCQLLPGVALAFRLDGLARVFTALVALLWPLASLYAFSYMEHEEWPNGFFAWYTVTYGVTLALACAENLLTLYLCYECLTLSTLPLVWHKQDDESIAAAKRYALFVIGGAALGFAALCGVLHLGGGEFAPGGSLPADTAQTHAELLRVLYKK